MISVIIPTLNAQATLAPTLAALVPAVVDGVVQEAIIADAGSTDDTRTIAQWAGTRLIDTERGAENQLAEGAKAAKGSWLLFINPDTVLDAGWAAEAELFMERVESGKRQDGAAVYRFALDEEGFLARLREWLRRLRFALFRRPCSDQGLLISRALYARLTRSRRPAGYDDLVRRLNRSELVLLRSRAVTSGRAYSRNEGSARGARHMLASYLRLPVRAAARSDR